MHLGSCLQFRLYQALDIVLFSLRVRNEEKNSVGSLFSIFFKYSQIISKDRWLAFLKTPPPKRKLGLSYLIDLFRLEMNLIFFDLFFGNGGWSTGYH